MKDALTTFVWFYLLVSAGAGCLIVGSFLVWCSNEWIWKAYRSVKGWSTIVEAMNALREKRQADAIRKSGS